VTPAPTETPSTTPPATDTAEPTNTSQSGTPAPATDLPVQNA
jgi:hypothetical protein